MGLAMSPRLDAVLDWLVDLSAAASRRGRIHFIAAIGLVAFVVVHVFEVARRRRWNQMRSMITGWYTVRRAVDQEQRHEKPS